MTDHPPNRERRLSVPPLRALAVAALLAGPASGKVLKRRWDHRSHFYPAPVARSQRGRAALYDSAELISAAARAGDVSADQIRAAHEALRLIASGSQPK